MIIIFTEVLIMFVFISKCLWYFALYHKWAQMNFIVEIIRALLGTSFCLNSLELLADNVRPLVCQSVSDGLTPPFPNSKNLTSGRTLTGVVDEKRNFVSHPRHPP